MRIAIVGAGRIGGNIARQAVRAGHHVSLSFARDQARLGTLAADLGQCAQVAVPADAVADAEVVVVSVPWDAIPNALDQTGSLDGKIVIDTTNQFSAGARADLGETAATHNARRMSGARYTKCFNTLTSAFQAEAANRAETDRIVQWLCGDDADAKLVVVALVTDLGYLPVDIGGTTAATVMEPPRRTGAVYGEEYRAADAAAVVDAVRAARPIPPTPVYPSSGR
jgi:predicted dinucleotide-binding enzyme